MTREKPKSYNAVKNSFRLKAIERPNLAGHSFIVFRG